MHWGNDKNAKHFIIFAGTPPPTHYLDTETFNAFKGILSESDSEHKEVKIIEDAYCDFMSHKDSNTKQLKSVHKLFYFKQKV